MKRRRNKRSAVTWDAPNRLFASAIPWLGRPKRLVLAYLAKYSSIRHSYAQAGEDLIAIELLSDKQSTEPLFYVDVGANHPSRLSNTYLLYRLGAKGITIEPNEDLCGLHRSIRPRDVQVSVGCGDQTGLKEFHYATAPVLSSFVPRSVERPLRTAYQSVFTLDKICYDLKVTAIDFLSIDTEGFDINVISGATASLGFTKVVCVEANSRQDAATLESLMDQHGFVVARRTNCNLFFVKRSKY